MSKYADLIGKKFKEWTVLGISPYTSRQTRLACRCSCGQVKSVRVCSLKSKDSSSCGCRKKLLISKIHTTHGKENTTKYCTWENIKQRCLNSKAPNYKNYGGRGIRVCKEWVNSFEQFYEDMGDKPGPKYSLDRLDNSGPYSKENCAWKTKKEQGRNKRNNVVLTYSGKTQSLIEWSEELNVNYSTLQGRISLGWSVENTLSTPVRIRLCKQK